jgi:hypothetical protein
MKQSESVRMPVGILERELECDNQAFNLTSKRVSASAASKVCRASCSQVNFALTHRRDMLVTIEYALTRTESVRAYVLGFAGSRRFRG